jgi:hypothetical protein
MDPNGVCACWRRNPGVIGAFVEVVVGAVVHGIVGAVVEAVARSLSKPDDDSSPLIHLHFVLLKLQYILALET